MKIPPDSVETTVEYGTMAAIYPDGRVRRMKHTVTRITKWRVLPLIGLTNCGAVIMGPWTEEWTNS